MSCCDRDVSNTCVRALFLVTPRALNDRFRTLTAQLPAASQALQAARQENLTELAALRPAYANDERIRSQRLFPLKELLAEIAAASTASELAGVVCLLREQRFVGAPVRVEIEAALVETVSRLRLKLKLTDEERDNLLSKLLFPSQMSPISHSTAESLLKAHCTGC